MESCLNTFCRFTLNLIRLYVQGYPDKDIELVCNGEVWSWGNMCIFPSLCRLPCFILVCILDFHINFFSDMHMCRFSVTSKTWVQSNNMCGSAAMILKFSIERRLRVDGGLYMKHITVCISFFVYIYMDLLKQACVYAWMNSGGIHAISASFKETPCNVQRNYQSAFRPVHKPPFPIQKHGGWLII